MKKAQINKIRNEKRKSYNRHHKIQRITRDYCKQVSANKRHNLKVVDKPLERHHLPRLNQEETENMYRPITNNETETVIKKTKSSPTQVQEQMASQVNYSKHLEKS